MYIELVGMFSFVMPEILDNIRYHDSHSKRRVGREDDKYRIPVGRNVFGVGMDHYFNKLKISSNEWELKTSSGSLTKPFRTILVLFMKIEGMEILLFLVSVFCKQQLMDG